MGIFYFLPPPPPNKCVGNQNWGFDTNGYEINSAFNKMWV